MNDAERFAVGRQWAEQEANNARNRLQTATSLAVAGLNAMTLINGGAIVALFTLIGQGADSAFVKALSIPHIIGAFCCFAGGVACCLLAFLIGYSSQERLSRVEQEWSEMRFASLAYDQELTASVADIDVGNRLLTAAVVLALVGIVAFVAGSALALTASLAAI